MLNINIIPFFSFIIKHCFLLVINYMRLQTAYRKVHWFKVKDRINILMTKSCLFYQYLSIPKIECNYKYFYLQNIHHLLYQGHNLCVLMLIAIQQNRVHYQKYLLINWTAGYGRIWRGIEVRVLCINIVFRGSSETIFVMRYVRTVSWLQFDV